MGLGLSFNPASQIRRQAPGAGRNRRLTLAENRRLLAVVDAYSNSMFNWIVRITLEAEIQLFDIGGLRLGQVDLKERVVRLDITRNSSLLTKAALAAMDNPTRPPETDLVFCGEPGRDGVRRSYLFDKTWTDAKKEAGLPVS